eukprot:5150861-Amphidinium_carterae.1
MLVHLGSQKGLMGVVSGFMILFGNTCPTGYLRFSGVTIPCTGGCAGAFTSLNVRPGNHAGVLYEQHIDIASKLWHRWTQLFVEVAKTNGIAVFEWPLTCKYWKADVVKSFFGDPMSKWRSTIVRGCGTRCAVGMVSTTGQPIGKRWLVYTNSAVVFDELQSLSRCTCGREHARVEGGDTVRSGHYPPRFAIAAHRAFR